MKMRALVTAGMLIVGLAAPCFAFEVPTGANSSEVQALLSSVGGGTHADRLIESVSCNINDEDKQAACMRACDDTWIKASQAYSGNIEKAKAAKKECEAKCGC